MLSSSLPDAESVSVSADEHSAIALTFFLLVEVQKRKEKRRKTKLTWQKQAFDNIHGNGIFRFVCFRARNGPIFGADPCDEFQESDGVDGASGRGRS